MDSKSLGKKIGGAVLTGVKNKAVKTVLNPINELVDQNLTDITTTLGSFIVRSVRGKFQRSITFTVGANYADSWMEEALYGVLYEYNSIKKSSRLQLTNKKGLGLGNGMYVTLDDGTHNLKYKNWEILLCIQTVSASSATRITEKKVYTIITYDLSPDFVKSFEKDMLNHRNALLKINSDSPTINVYTDAHDPDGYTYWELVQHIPKRRLNTIYLPEKQKKLLVDTINTFFASKKYYTDHGIPHNLKILLYGEPGTGKSSIAKMIASEWNRNLYECKGGKNGKFIPDAITSPDDSLSYPLLSISDIDKYPFLINEPEINIDKSKEENNAKEDQMAYKQIFGNMINALDGIMSGEDKIIVMTTNHIEKFAPVILRPGRIDLQLYVTYITPEVFRKYVWDFYHVELPEDIKLTKKNITIADLQFDVVFLKMDIGEFLKKYVK